MKRHDPLHPCATAQTRDVEYAEEHHPGQVTCELCRQRYEHYYRQMCEQAYIHVATRVNHLVEALELVRYGFPHPERLNEESVLLSYAETEEDLVRERNRWQATLDAWEDHEEDPHCVLAELGYDPTEVWETLTGGAQR